MVVGKKTEEAPAAAETTTEAAAPEYKLMTDLPTVDITTSSRKIKRVDM